MMVGPFFSLSISIFQYAFFPKKLQTVVKRVRYVVRIWVMFFLCAGGAWLGGAKNLENGIKTNTAVSILDYNSDSIRVLLKPQT
jgi:hypothetical protein